MMTFEVYKALCKILIKKQMFLHFPSSTWPWNWILCLAWKMLMIAMPKILSHSKMHLVFTSQKPNTNQLRKRDDTVWHVYTNPRNPSFVQFFYCSLFIFLPRHTHPRVHTFGHWKSCSVTEQFLCQWKWQSFPRRSSVWFFMNVPAKSFMTTQMNSSKWMDAGDLGLHSFLKCSCRYAVAGAAFTPPIVSICVQAM